MPAKTETELHDQFIEAALMQYLVMVTPQWRRDELNLNHEKIQRKFLKAGAAYGAFIASATPGALDRGREG